MSFSGPRGPIGESCTTSSRLEREISLIDAILGENYGAYLPRYVDEEGNIYVYIDKYILEQRNDALRRYQKLLKGVAEAIE